MSTNSFEYYDDTPPPPRRQQLVIPPAPGAGQVTDPALVRLLEDLYSTINFADKRCFVLDGQVEKANDQLARMRKRLKEVTPAKSAAERRAAELEDLERRDKSEIAALKTENKELKKQMREMSGDRRAGDKSVVELERELMRMRDELQSMRRERDNAEATRTQLANRVRDAEKDGVGQVSTIRQERDRILGLVTERDDYIKSLETDLKTARSAHGPLKKQINDLMHEQTHLQTSLRDAKEQARRDEAEMTAFRKQVTDRDLLLRKNAETLAKLTDLDEVNKEDKLDRSSVKRERDRLLALIQQSEIRITELESAARKDKDLVIKLRAQVKEQSDANSGWTRERAVLEDQRSEDQTAIDELKSKLTRLERELSRIKDEGTERQVELETADKKLTTQKTSLTELESRDGAQNRQINELKASLDTLQEQSGRDGLDLTALRKQVLQLATLKRQVDEVTEENSLRGERIVQLEGGQKKAKEEIAQLTQQMAAMTDIKNSLERLKQEAENALKKSRDEAAEQKNALLELKSSSEMRTNELSVQRDRLSAEIAAARKELGDRRNAHDAKMDEMEGSARKLTAEIHALKTQLFDQQGSFERRGKELQGQLEREVEDARGLRTQLAEGKRNSSKRISELEGAFTAAQDDLKEKKKKVDDLVAWKASALEQISTLEAAAKRDNDEAKATAKQVNDESERKQKQLHEMSETLQKQLQETNETFAGVERVSKEMEAQKKKDDAEIASLSKEVSDLKTALPITQRRTNDLEAENKAHKEEIDRLSHALEDERDGCASSDRRVNELATALKKAQDEATSLRHQCEDDNTIATKQILELEMEIERKKEREAALLIKNDDLEIARGAADKRVIHLESRLTSQKEDIHELRQQMGALESLKTSLEGELLAASSALSKEKHDAVQLKEKLREQTEAEVAARNLVSDLERDLKKCAADLALTKVALADQLTTTEAIQQELKEFRDTAKKDVSEWKRQADKKDSSVRELQEKIVELTSQNTRDRAELDALRKLRSEMVTLTSRLEEVQAAAAEANRRLVETERQANDARRKGEALEREKRELESAFETAATDGKRASADATSAKRILDALRGEKAATDELLTESEAACKRAKTEVSALKKELLEANAASVTRLLDLEDAFERGKLEIASLSKKLADSTTAVNGLREDLEAADAHHKEETTSLRKHLSASVSNVKQLEAYALTHNDQVDALRQQLEDGRKNSQARAHFLEQNLIAVRDEAEALKGQLSGKAMTDRRYAEMEAAARLHQAELGDLSHRLQGSENARTAAEKRLAILEASSKTDKDELITLLALVAELETAKKANDRRVADIALRLTTKTEETDAILAKLHAVSDANAGLDRKVLQLSAQLKKATGDVNMLREHIQSLSASDEDNAHKNAVLERDLKKAVSDVFVCARQLEELSEEANAAKTVHAAVEGQLAKSKVEVTELRQQVEELTNASRIANEQLHSMQGQARRDKDSLAALRLEVDSLSTAQEGSGAALVEAEARARKDRERLAEMVEMASASRDRELAQDVRLDDLQHQLRRSEDRCTLLNHKISELTETERILQEQLLQAETTVATDKRQLSMQLGSMKSDRDRLQDDVNNHQVTIDELKASLRRAEDKVASLTSRVSEMDEEESALQERLSLVETQATIDKKQSAIQLTAMRKEKDDLTMRVSELEQALLLEKEDSAQATGLKKQLAAVHAELDRVVSASASAEQTKAEKDRRIQELNSAQMTTEHQLAMLSDDQSTLFKKIESLEYGIKTRDESVSAAEKELLETATAKALAEQKLLHLEAKVQEKDLINDELKSQLDDARKAFKNSKDEANRKYQEMVYQHELVCDQLKESLATAPMAKKRIEGLERELHKAKEEIVGFKFDLEAVHAQLDKADQTKNEKDRQIDDLNTSQKTIEKQLAIKVEESFKAEGTASARIERLAELLDQLSLAKRELEDQLTTASKQSKDAATLFLADLKSINDELKATKVELEASKQSLEATEKALENSNDQLKASRDELTAHLTECSQTHRIAQANIAQLQTKLDNTEWELRSQLTMLTDVHEDHLADSAAAAVAAKKTIEELGTSLQASDDRTAELERQLRNEQSGHERALKLLQDELEDLINQSAAADEVSRLRGDSLEGQLRASQEALTTAESERMALQTRLHEIERLQRDAAHRAEDLQRSLTGSETENAARIRQLTNEVTDLMQRNTTALARIGALESELLLSQNEAAAQLLVLQETKRELTARISELLKKQETIEYELKWSKDEHEVHVAKIDTLERNLQAGKDEMATHVEECTAAQRAAGARIAELMDQLKGSDSTLKGSEQQLQSTKDELTKELNEIKAAHAAAMAVVVELTAQSEALKKEHAAQQLAHEATIDELKQNIAFSSVPELQAENASLNRRLKSAVEESDLIGAERIDLRSAVTSLEEAVLTYGEELAGVRSELIKVSGDLSTAQMELAERSIELDLVKKELDRAVDRTDSGDEEIEQLTRKLAVKTNELEQEKMACREQAEHIAATEARLAVVQQSMETAVAARAIEEAAHAEAQEDLRELTVQCSALKQQLDDSEEMLRESAHQQSSLEAQASKDRLEILALIAQVDHLTTANGTLEERQTQFDAQSEELVRLKTQIEALTASELSVGSVKALVGDQLAAAQLEAKELRIKLEVMTTARADAERRSLLLETESGDRQEEERALRKQLGELVEAGTAATRRNVELEQQLLRNQIETDSLREQLAALDLLKCAGDRSLSGMEDALDRQTRERETLAVKCLGLGAEREDLMRDLERKESIIKALQSERDRILEEAEGSIGELESKMHDGDVRRKTLREEMLALQQDRDTVAMRLAAAEARESELMKGYEQLRQELTDIQEECLATQEQCLTLQDHVRVSDDDLSQTQEMLQSLSLEYQKYQQNSESNAEESQGQYQLLADQMRSLIDEYSNYKESSDAFRVEVTIQISQFEEQEVATQKELLTLNHQKAGVDTNLAAVTKELHESVAEQERLSSLLRDLALEFQKFKSETEIIITGLNRELQAAAERSALSSTDLESLNEQLSTQLRDIHSVFDDYKDVSERRVADMETKAKADLSTIAALTTAIASAEEQISALTMQGMNDTEEIVSLKTRVPELEAALTKLQLLEQSDKATIASLTLQFQEAKEMSVALACEYEAFKNHTVTTITDLNSNLGATRDRSLSSNAELEASVIQLKDTLQALAKEFQEYKQNAVANAAGFSASLKTTLDELAASTKSYQALATAKASSDARISELEGQGSKDTSDIVALQAQLTERSDMITKLSQELASATKSYKELAAANRASDDRISQLEGQGAKDKVDMVELQAQLSERSDLLSKLVQEYSEFKNASQQHELVAEQSIQDLNKRLTAAQDRSLQSHSELSDANAQLTDSLMALAKEFQGYKTQAEVRTTDLEAKALLDHEAMLSNRQKLLALAAEYEGMLNDCNEKISRANHDLSERTKDVDTVRCELETLQSWRVMAQANQADMNTAYAELQTQFASLQQNYDELSSRDQDKNMHSSTLKGNLAAIVAEYSNYKVTMENDNKSLYTQLAECKEQWSATAKEYQSYKMNAEKSIAEANARAATMGDKGAKSTAELASANAVLQQQLSALVAEYTGFKEVSEKAVAELHERSLLVKQEHEQLLRQNKRSSTREADLKASYKMLQDQWLQLKQAFEEMQTRSEAFNVTETSLVAKLTLAQEELLTMKREQQELQQKYEEREEWQKKELQRMEGQAKAHAMATAAISADSPTRKGVAMGTEIPNDDANLVLTVTQTLVGLIPMPSPEKRKEDIENDLVVAQRHIVDMEDKIEKLKEICSYNKNRYNDLLTWKDLATSREADLRDANALLRTQLLTVSQRRDALANSIQLVGTGAGAGIGGITPAQAVTRHRKRHNAEGGSEVGSVASGTSSFIPDLSFGYIGSATTALLSIGTTTSPEKEREQGTPTGEPTTLYSFFSPGTT